MIGVMTSQSNQCKYCTTHHKEALNNYWKDDEKLEKFLEDYHKIGLSNKDIALCDYAKNLTETPYQSDEEAITNLKQADLSEREILDATMIVAYFNFVNRIVLALGVSLEENRSGYKY